MDLHRAQKPIDHGETGLAGRLLKKAGQEETVVRPSDTIDPKALATARKLAPEYLLDADKINTADAPKIAAAYRVQLERDRETLTRDQERAGRGYPFGTALTEAQTTVDALLTTSGTAALMAGILAQQDALEDWVDLRARVQNFYAGEQVRIFEEVRDDLKDLEPDLPRVNVPELQDRIKQARALLTMPDPVREIPKLKACSSRSRPTWLSCWPSPRRRSGPCWKKRSRACRQWPPSWDRTRPES